ncbi:MAG: glycosyltransferase family 2 protein [Flavobacteriales bacterium]|nr:glycosyltransferase family 2 protein [Flavobacteriales bacterium]
MIITKNEAQNIERCIQSLSEVCKEIVVMDSGSSDNTLKFAERAGAKVFTTEWKGYAATKNYANSLVSSDFVLSIDADEILSESLKTSIKKALTKGLKGTYSFNRKNNYVGKWIRFSGWYPDEKIRIFNRNEVFWEGDFVHETLVVPSSTSNTKLKGDLLHYSYNSTQEHLERSKKYALLAADRAIQNGKSVGFFKPYVSAFAKFIETFLLKFGFLDGLSGFEIARISALGSFLKYKTIREGIRE